MQVANSEAIRAVVELLPVRLCMDHRERTAVTVSASQRYTRSRPCPICGGHERAPRDRGERCAGFLSTDGFYARCTREEHAGHLVADERTDPPTYLHRIGGPCKCGKEHGPPAANHRQATNGTRAREVACYEYVDREGHLLYQNVRYEPKDFRVRRPDGAGGWIYNRTDPTDPERKIPAVVRHLDQLYAAPKGSTIYFTEGEKDEIRLRELGLSLVTTAGSSTMARSVEDWVWAQRQHLVFFADNDHDGEKSIGAAAPKVRGAGAASVKVVRFPDLHKGGDVSDWLGRGHTLDDLLARIASADEWSASVDEHHDAAGSNGKHGPVGPAVALTVLTPPDRLILPTLPQPFWDSRASLQAIRQAAHSRGRSPDGVVAVLAARVAAAMPPKVRLPPIVGSFRPLSTYAAVVARPGRGKGDAASIAAELIPFDPQLVRGPIPIGTGEGIVESYFGMIRDPDDPKKQLHVRTCNSVYLNADEGEAMEKIAQRNGATLLSVLRTAWSGQDVGQGNASTERRRILEGGTYSLGLTMNLQPDLCGWVLADMAAGTPQRFVWASTCDPSIPRDRPAWPDTEHLRIGLDRVKYLHQHDELEGYHTIEVPYEVADAIREADWRIQTGEAEPDDMAAHHDLVRLKLAGILACLDGHPTLITVEDWQLATTWKDTSDQVREQLQVIVAGVVERKEAHTTAVHVGREVAKADALDARAEARQLQNTVECAEWIRDKVRRDPGATVAELRRRGSPKIRHAFLDGLAHAQAQGWVVEREEQGQGGGKRVLYSG